MSQHIGMTSSILSSCCNYKVSLLYRCRNCKVWDLTSFSSWSTVPTLPTWDRGKHSVSQLTFLFSIEIKMDIDCWLYLELYGVGNSSNQCNEAFKICVRRIHLRDIRNMTNRMKLWVRSKWVLDERFGNEGGWQLCLLYCLNHSQRALE